MAQRNIYAEQVAEHEILDSESDREFGRRLTKVRCYICEAPFAERELWVLRDAKAPECHPNCRKGDNIYYISGEDVRSEGVDDRILEATRAVTIGKLHMLPGNIAWYNGKSILTRPCGYAPECDQETNDINAVELALRRGWLKPYVKPENKPIAKLKSKGQWVIDRLKKLNVSNLELPLIGRPPKNNK